MHIRQEPSNVETNKKKERRKTSSQIFNLQLVISRKETYKVKSFRFCHIISQFPFEYVYRKQRNSLFYLCLFFNSTASYNYFPLHTEENKQRINQASNKLPSSSQQFTDPNHIWESLPLQFQNLRNIYSMQQLQFTELTKLNHEKRKQNGSIKKEKVCMALLEEKREELEVEELQQRGLMRRERDMAME